MLFLENGKIVEEGTYDELYDLRKDPNELNNVISEDKYRGHRERLQKQLVAFRAEQNVDEW